MECMFEELSRAVSVAEVVSVTRHYLATWSREELERLPDSCRPAWIRGVQDIEAWADRLVDISGKAAMFMEDERKLDRLTSHFLIASVRIRQLALAYQVPMSRRCMS
jgi:hypothetical protein